jgi:hypothetical protein
MILRMRLGIALAAASACCPAYSGDAPAPPAPLITYSASGTFGTPPFSGADTLKLAGEPFSVSIAVSAATKPVKSSANSATYNKLKLTGSVYSGLLGSTPVSIASGEATIIQSIDPGLHDVFTMEAPVKVVGISLTIKAVITMPAGTITKPLLHPFTKPVALAPGNATLTYSDSSASTVLSVQTGALDATIPTGGPIAKAVRPIGAAPVDLGFATDSTTLKFCATGVTGASEVPVRIGYFPGLDEVMV